MNKKALYESIMRSVAVEVKKALNEAADYIMPRNTATTGIDNLYIMVDTSGSVNIRDAKQAIMNELKRIVFGNENYRIFVGNTYDYVADELCDINPNAPLGAKRAKVERCLNTCTEVMGGTDINGALKSLVSNMDLNTDTNTLVLISDMEDDIDAIMDTIDNADFNEVIFLIVDLDGNVQIERH